MPTEETAEEVIRNFPYNNANDFSAYMKTIDMHYDFFKKSGTPYAELRSRVDVERSTIDTLKKLQSGDIYIVKGGDLDFFREEEGKWDQIGSANIRSVYREALQRGVSIKVMENSDPIRKNLRKAEEIYKILVELGLRPKLTNHNLRAVLARKVDGNLSGAVWYNFSKHSDFFESDDPSLSTYKGYFISSEEKNCLHFLTSLEKNLTEIENSATDYKDFVEKNKANFHRARRGFIVN